MPSLRADCEHCLGLCCVVPAFSASADFAIDKPAGQPCPNLRSDSRCSIHEHLRQRGFAGCAVYDCFGAGQRVVQLFGGRDRGPQMFAAFTVMRQLHELLWYLGEALALPPARPLHAELALALDETERLAAQDPDALEGLDVDAHRNRVNALLLQASALVRGPGRPDFRGADLVGKDLRRVDLRGASLRGARLVGADLRAADLSLADLTGADLRGADLRGADLRTSIFLTRSQLDAARVGPTTRVTGSGRQGR